MLYAVEIKWKRAEDDTRGAADCCCMPINLVRYRALARPANDLSLSASAAAAAASAVAGSVAMTPPRRR